MIRGLDCCDEAELFAEVFYLELEVMHPEKVLQVAELLKGFLLRIEENVKLVLDSLTTQDQQYTDLLYPKKM